MTGVKMYRLKTARLIVLISFLCWILSGCTTREQSEISVVGSTTATKANKLQRNAVLYPLDTLENVPLLPAKT